MWHRGWGGAQRRPQRRGARVDGDCKSQRARRIVTSFRPSASRAAWAVPAARKQLQLQPKARARKQAARKQATWCVAQHSRGAAGRLPAAGCACAAATRRPGVVCCGERVGGQCRTLCVPRAALRGCMQCPNDQAASAEPRAAIGRRRARGPHLPPSAAPGAASWVAACVWRAEMLTRARRLLPASRAALPGSSQAQPCGQRAPARVRGTLPPPRGRCVAQRALPPRGAASHG